MSPLVSVIIKNSLLLILIIINLLFVFTPNISFQEINYWFIGLGGLYCIAACLEALVLSQINLSAKHYTYFTSGFITKRFLKIIFFIACGLLLLYSHSIIRYVSVLCFIIAFTELAVTIWRYWKNLCFITFQNNQIIISTNKQISFNAANISKIEFRHGLTYFVTNQNKSLMLRTDILKDKEDFKIELLKWIDENHLTEKLVK